MENRKTVNTDYRLEALDILLDKSCLIERYYPLIGYKDALLSGLRLLGCQTKNDALSLPDSALAQMGLNDPKTISLFRRFLSLYDPDPKKLREIASLTSDPEEQAAFWELYHLPGVKQIRASLYYRSGFRTLRDIADATAGEIIEKTSRTISQNALTCVKPLPKEVRTHIAVAKAFLLP